MGIGGDKWSRYRDIFMIRVISQFWGIFREGISRAENVHSQNVSSLHEPLLGQPPETLTAENGCFSAVTGGIWILPEPFACADKDLCR